MLPMSHERRLHQCRLLLRLETPVDAFSASALLLLTEVLPNLTIASVELSEAVCVANVLASFKMGVTRRVGVEPPKNSRD